MSNRLSINSKIKANELRTDALIYTDIPEGRRAEILENCYYLIDSVHGVLDLRNEISSVTDQKLGETILITNHRGNYVQGLAICHCGPKTEAGSKTCYVKFGLAAPISDKSAAVNFGDLLKLCLTSWVI
jgi:hypothetical protein